MGLISRVSSRTYRVKKSHQFFEKMSTYRLAEVKTHNTKGSAWLVVHNKVYDVTNFMQEHPGGEEVLLDVLGTDSTESFEDVGHSNDARDLLANYLLGELHPDDCSSDNPKSGNYVWQATDKKENKEKESNTTMVL